MECGDPREKRVEVLGYGCMYIGGTYSACTVRLRAINEKGMYVRVVV